MSGLSVICAHRLALAPRRCSTRSARIIVKCSNVSYDDRLLEAERLKDSMQALELLTEVCDWSLDLSGARITGVEVSASAAEAGIRIIASSSPSKSFDILSKQLLAKGILPCPDNTLPVLLKALSSSGDSASFLKLLEAVQDDVMSHASSSRVLNLAVRCMAKFDVDAAVLKAEEYRKQEVLIESSTYSQLAAKSLTAGNFEQAEQMLEMRDYM